MSYAWIKDDLREATNRWDGERGWKAIHAVQLFSIASHIAKARLTCVTPPPQIPPRCPTAPEVSSSYKLTDPPLLPDSPPLAP
jgi:hypothetical protein